MTRRDPPLGKVIPAYNASVNGLVTLIAPSGRNVVDLKSLSIASNGGAGTAEFAITNGVSQSPFKTLAVAANASAECTIGGYELPIGSGLAVTTTTDMAITAWHSVIDESLPLTKEQARTNTHNMWKAQKAAKQNAIRTPNRFGDQVEG